MYGMTVDLCRISWEMANIKYILFSFLWQNKCVTCGRSLTMNDKHFHFTFGTIDFTEKGFNKITVR